jgi:alpha-L-fucosidase
MQHFNDGRDWFFEKRFGMFIHWGLYAIPAWHEQLQWRKRVPRDEYSQLATQWNPAHFDPDKWIDLAEAAGMQYLCFTTKHHDGFCLWNTAQTEFNTMNTPYAKDVLAQLADACHRRNFPLCLYYSCVDWHHPNYPNAGRSHELPKPLPGDKPDLEKYIDFVKAQVRELCTNYGEIHGFWWDLNIIKHVDPSVNAIIRELQPKAIINDRGYGEGDFGTPERDVETSAEAEEITRPTEACQSVSAQSWGFRANDDYYTTEHLIRSIDRYLARGANYLLNVGPTADGVIPPQSEKILRRIGQWFKSVQESLLDTIPTSDFTANSDVLVTRHKSTFYIHLCKKPICNTIQLKPIKVLPRRATLLNNNAPVECVVDMLPNDHVSQELFLRLRNLPVVEFDDEVLVVKLEFEESFDNLINGL